MQRLGRGLSGRGQIGVDHAIACGVTGAGRQAHRFDPETLCRVVAMNPRREVLHTGHLQPCDDLGEHLIVVQMRRTDARITEVAIQLPRERIGQSFGDDVLPDRHRRRVPLGAARAVAQIVIELVRDRCLQSLQVFRERPDGDHNVACDPAVSRHAENRLHEVRIAGVSEREQDRDVMCFQAGHCRHLD